uniref:hypothetical protein n=1 Tax=Alistipes shahii TaxID=328814 RepID=UPI003AAC89D6
CLADDLHDAVRFAGLCLPENQFVVHVAKIGKYLRRHTVRTFFLSFRQFCAAFVTIYDIFSVSPNWHRI